MERSRKPFNELIGIPIAVVPINTSYDQQSSGAPIGAGSVARGHQPRAAHRQQYWNRWGVWLVVVHGPFFSPPLRSAFSVLGQ